MDELQQLWDLYEEMRGVPKPQLRDDPPASMGAPPNGYADHPVIQDREKVDMMRKTGLPAETAHQQVHGDLDTSDTDAKAKFAATLGRTQEDGGRANIYIDKDADHPSILAIDDQLEKDAQQTSVKDLRTPVSKQVPNAVQGDEANVTLTQQEEVDYNEDAEYLRLYGRA